MTRVWLLLVVLLVLGRAAVADTVSFQAGMSRVSVSGADGFDMLVWYPAQADTSIASGRFPIVLLAHGGGLTGGTPLILSEISASLARHGYVVVAPFHGTSGLPRRVVRMREALDAFTGDARFAPHTDPARLGMLGYSLGGAVALELAGAIPDLPAFEAYCAAHPDDAMSCDHAPGGGNRPGPLPTRRAIAPLPLKAIILLDPFGALFQREGVVAVTMPVLLFRPEQSELPGAANAFALRQTLPRPPRYETVPGGHFVFTDVCAPPHEANVICRDPPGVHRAAVHEAVEGRIAGFFDEHL